MMPIPTRADGLGIVIDASWLSDHEILHAVRGVLCRYDIISHVNTALPALQHQLTTSAPFSATFVASPDSQWVLWDQANVNPTFCAATVYGSKSVHWPEDGEVGQSFWCADSRRWLRFRFGEPNPRTPFHLPLVHARLEDINHPQSAASFAVPPGLRDLEVLAAVSEHEVMARTPDPVLPYQAPKHPMLTRKARKKAPTQDSNVLTVTRSITVTLRATQEISVWDLNALTPRHRYTVTLPSIVLAVAVSQAGDRAAWLLSAWKDNRLTTSLWVSGLDGSKLHEVGAIPADTVGATSQAPTDVRWLPGDKSVSFVYKDALWAVRAD